MPRRTLTCESINTNPEPRPRRRTLTVNFDAPRQPRFRTTYQPRRVSPGNHEAYGTQGGGAFEQFALRYRAVRENAGANSGSPNNFWYSFQTPLIHWIAFTAESWTMTPAQLAEQAAWIAADVAKVDRTVTPWVVAFSHKAWQMDSTTC